MNNQKIVLSAALAGACGLALAQEPVGSVSVGAGYWSDDRPRWGVYDGMHEEGGYLLLDGYYRRRDDATGTWLRLDASNLGLDTRELRAEWLRQGNMGFFVEYSRIPREDPFTYFTGVQGIGTTTLRVPAVASPPLTEVHLGTVRDRVGAGFLKHFGGGYDFRVTFTNEEKTGTRLWGRGGAPEFAVEPIDSTTRQLEAIVSYTGQTFQLQGGYYGSWYTNDNKLVDTALTTGANPFFLSLPLDNQAHQVYVNGGYNFTPATRATFKVSYMQATQDEQIPLAPGVAVFAGAPTNLDGRLDNTLIEAGLTSRTSSTFSWLAKLRYYESDEKTPQRRIVQTGVPPAPPCPTCVDNTPLTFETIIGKIEGTYRFAQGLSLMAGIEYSKQDRNVPFGNLDPTGTFDAQRYVPFRAELEETTYRVQLRRALSETINGSIGYAYSERDGSDFTRTNELQSDQINPIHIADRDRNRFRLMVDWTPTQPLTVTFNAEYAKDDYGFSEARPFGLREGEAYLYSLDVAYAVSERWQVNAWYARDNTQATQVGQRAATGTAGAAVKVAELEDTGDNFGAGVQGLLSARLKGGVDLLYSKNVNRYPETIGLTGPGTLFPAGITGPLPDIKNELVRFKLYAIYALQKNSDIRIDYIHERWETNDWTWLFADGSRFTYGTTTDGTQVFQAPKQNADFIGLRYIHRFQ
jgi:MtrB/PioB family decaheme-associated outer membrane protein